MTVLHPANKIKYREGDRVDIALAGDPKGYRHGFHRRFCCGPDNRVTPDRRAGA